MTYDNQPSRAAARDARRRRGIGGAARIGLLLFAALVVLGAVGAGVAVAGFASLSAGLPDPSKLEQIELPEQSVVWDRTHTVELARFGQFNRDVVTFDQIPPVLVDATTAIEDATFWDNAGFDPVGIVAAGFDAIRGKPRGASTITQQLVRQRLLTDNGSAQTEVSATRKIKEIIQSIRVTQAFPGVAGKQRIMAAYLNQNYYGNESYGVAAAARGYFGKELKDLTLAQAAIIAAIPQAPSTYDLVQNANEECIDPSADPQTCKTQLVVPDDARIVQRRNLVLDQMAKGRTPLTGTQFSAAEFAAAKTEKVVLAPQKDTQWKANHFVWQVRRELSATLCGVEAETCPKLERGGLDITSTLDWRLQQAGEKWVQAAAIVPHAKNPAAAAKALGLSYDTWMKNLRSRDLQNSALIAQDYQTGEIVAYVGSANVYATKATKKFQPRFDVLADGWRQPGSAFKPIVYGTGIGGRYLTAASMFMDVTTDFGGNYVPTDADNLERGPVRVRDALRFSLNIPAVKAMSVIGKDAVQAQAEKMGINFLNGKVNAGLSFALGVAEVHPKDLVRAYGALADGGQLADQTTILEVKDGSGTTILSPDTRPKPEQVIDPGAAGIITDILAGNTDPNQNPFWGKFELLEKGKHRPATLKTGTNNDAKDLNAYGYVGVPSSKDRANGEYALAVGVWNGNSDNSLVSTANAPLFSIDVATYVWQGFLKDATKGWSINGFTKTDGLQTADVDPWTGLAAQPGAPSVKELFLSGTTPAGNVPQDARCGNGVLQTAGFEKDHKTWLQADDDWLSRARRGAGVSGGPKGTRTTYFYNGVFNPYGRSWGPLLGSSGDCATPTPSASASVDPCASPAGSVDPSAAVPSALCPSPSGSPSASPSESPPVATPTPTASSAPTPPPTAPPTPKPTAPPTPAPTPPPTPAPTPSPTPSASPS